MKISCHFCFSSQSAFGGRFYKVSLVAEKHVCLFGRAAVIDICILQIFSNWHTSNFLYTAEKNYLAGICDKDMLDDIGYKDPNDVDRIDICRQCSHCLLFFVWQANLCRRLYIQILWARYPWSENILSFLLLFAKYTDCPIKDHTSNFLYTAEKNYLAGICDRDL